MTELSIQKEKPVMLSVRQAAATGVLPERALRRLIAEKKATGIGGFAGTEITGDI